MSGFDNSNGFVLCVSGPSGSGKTSLCDKLCQDVDFAVRSISVTTRPQRSGEVSGQDYIFVNREEFEKRQAKQEFLETAEVFGNLYGTPKAPVFEAIDRGKVIVMDIDTIGAHSVKKELEGRCHSVFLLPPSLEELKKRLESRRQNTPQEVKYRLTEAQREIAEADWYEKVIENTNFDQAYKELQSYLLDQRESS